jgi:hypothetical protein
MKTDKLLGEGVAEVAEAGTVAEAETLAQAGTKVEVLAVAVVAIAVPLARPAAKMKTVKHHHRINEKW